MALSSNSAAGCNDAMSVAGMLLFLELNIGEYGSFLILRYYYHEMHCGIEPRLGEKRGRKSRPYKILQKRGG
jgi:hypothetical protein